MFGTLKQPTFDWKAPDKHHELCNFEIQVKDIFLTNNYNIQESKKVPIIMNRLDHDRLRFVQSLYNEEKEPNKTNLGLFKVLRTQWKHQLNYDIDMCKNIPFISTVLSVAVQWEDGRPWMYGTVMGHG